MGRRFAVALVVAGVCGTSFVVHGQSKGKPVPENVLVASELRDANDVGAFQLRSDGLGTYTSGDGVVSQIWANGDWELNLSAQTSRGVDLTLTTVDGSPSTVPSGRYQSRLISRCFSADGNSTGYLQIAEGAANARCAMRVNFTSGGASYYLVMSPLYAGTSWVTVSCPADTDANATCERWLVSPDQNAASPGAALYRVGRSKDVFVGNYVLTFALSATR